MMRTRNLQFTALLIALGLLVPAVAAQNDADAEKAALIGDIARRVEASTPSSPGAPLLGTVFFPNAPCEALPDSVSDDGDSSNDFGWLLVDFCTAGATGSGSAQPPECHHNDDDSAVLALPFNFDHYGTTFTSTFVNNNGNLSFDQLFSTFTASGFPIDDFPMVAPFWGDVDTGNPNNRLGNVWYKFIGGNTLAVSWERVGYFNEQADKRNTFQLLISDGTNAAMGLGNNSCFCYDDMQWTTGSASNGVGGFGGVPATVGANKGDGVEFFQIGRFDHAGVDYDGPGGNSDGVSFLDNVVTCFNTGVQGNVPPIAQGFPVGNLYIVPAGTTLNDTVGFISPELAQTTTIAVNDGGLANFSSAETPGNPATSAISFSPDAAQAGDHAVTFVATDNGVPNESTTVVVTLRVTVPCVDNDQDGFGDPASPGCASPGLDCDDNDPGVNPDQPENCNNGIDDDCDGRIDQDQSPECGVLLVELESFAAEQTRQGVVLRWSTVSEIGNLGFRLIREKVPAVAGKSGGEAPVAIQLNEQLIQAVGSELFGADYEYLDHAKPRPGTYRYYLEDIDISGLVTRHGPVTVQIAKPGRGKR